MLWLHELPDFTEMFHVFQLQIWTWEAEGCGSSLIFWYNASFFLDFQALSDAVVFKSKYCPSVAGPRIKHHLIKYWSKKSDALSHM